jgi:uncharacterized damage-inducible protein DinB
MLADAIEKCPEVSWRQGTPPLEIGRLAFHIVDAADFYGRQTMAEPIEPRSCGVEPRTIFQLEAGSLPSKSDVKDLLRHVEKKWNGFLSDKDDAWYVSKKPAGIFEWTGTTYLDLCLYNLRHVMHHLGHMDVQIRQAKGSPMDWL